MRRRLTALILCGATLIASAFAAPAMKVLPVGDYSISLGWDPAWQSAGPDAGAPRNTTRIQLADPHDMLVLISAQPRPSADANVDAYLQHVIDSAVKEFEGQSIEKQLEPRAFTHGDMHGYEVCATDKAPKPDEFKFVCQGVTTNGDVAVVYTVLYNDGGKAQAEKASAALESMQIATGT